ncbi:Arm DNA-binding domain-containing protein [Bartonella harrusi]|uniref:Arm DNA-binding domain-containing protein n=1 Tax=Bartonella harrusi TaxID=2961895 RepID=A0ABY5EUV7_9HYPH|nr:Arm DNA-binding domain-containing protein [Bartonella harrusi]UTO28210.1 Arm DNA-binding domain-containing protein [Bartonella harrusi]
MTQVTGGAQWLYRYTIHGHRREVSLGALREISLKKAREFSNTITFAAA